ncbi:MAG: hypothetical protein ACLR2O_06415 [Coprococcus sp.]
MKTTVPSHLQDAHYGGAAEYWDTEPDINTLMGDYPHHYVEQQYLRMRLQG